MKPVVLALILALGTPVLAASQELAEVRRLYNAAKYGEVVEAVSKSLAEVDGPPRLVFLQAQAYDRLDNAAGVTQAYGRLASGQYGDAWRLVGESGTFLAQKNVASALERAEQAAAAAPDLAEAHYQLGLALGHQGDWTRASTAFERATQLDADDAYAHYHAGLAFSRIRRADRTGVHFEAFLRLAPDAPERGEVESIMRTLRGR